MTLLLNRIVIFNEESSKEEKVNGRIIEEQGPIIQQMQIL